MKLKASLFKKPLIPFLFFTGLLLTEYLSDVILGDGDGIISHPVFYHLLTFSYLLFGALFFFSIWGNWIKDICIKIVNIKWLQDNFFGAVPSPVFLSVFRIVYALVCMVLTYRYIYYIPLVHYGKSEDILKIIELTHYGWLFIISLILLGTRYRIFYLIHFILISLLYGSDIGCFMLKMGAFWMIFMVPQGTFFIKNKYLKFVGLSHTESFNTPKWSVFLLGLNLSFIITIAGIYKAFDPVWLNGLGFYYAFLQPWIKVEHSSFLLDHKWFIYPMNYLSIIFETFAFFLFFSQRTRWLSMIFMFCFLGLVLYPLRIDPVGPAGLTLLIVLCSLFRFPKFSMKHTPIPNVQKKIAVNNSNMYLFIALAVFISQLTASTVENFRKLKYPFTEYPFQTDQSIDKKVNADQQKKGSYITSFSERFLVTINHTMNRTMNHIPRIIGYYAIFNYHHSFARSYYTMTVETDRNEYVPFKIYNKDGTIDPNGLRAGFLKPLTIHVVYAELAIIYHKINITGDLKNLNISNWNCLRSLMNFALVKAKKENPDQNIVNTRIKINPILVPPDYVGNYKNISSEWKMVICYNIQEDLFSIEKSSYPVDFSEINIPEFRNKKIVFNPF